MAGADHVTPIKMLKVDLHTHTSDDPCDRIPHTAAELRHYLAHLGHL
jgi:hypothetical protein